MNRLLICLLLICFLLAFSVTTGMVHGDDNAVGALISQGIDAYAEGQALTDRDARLAAFGRSEALFMEAARRGDGNADLYANAGTAALQAERLGPAILAFRRALAIDPDHPRANRNLTHARTLLPAWVPRLSGESDVLDTFFFWHRSLSTAERAGISALSFMLAAIFLAVGVRWRSRLARGLALVPALGWLGLIASLLVEVGGGRSNDAVITVEETVARASDSANAPARFADPLPGGTEVEVIETRDRWARIRLANGREAWVGRQSLGRVFESEA